MSLFPSSAITCDWQTIFTEQILELLVFQRSIGSLWKGIIFIITITCFLSNNTNSVPVKWTKDQERLFYFWFTYLFFPFSWVVLVGVNLGRDIILDQVLEVLSAAGGSSQLLSIWALSLLYRTFVLHIGQRTKSSSIRKQYKNLTIEK